MNTLKIGWGRREISIDEPVSIPGQMDMRISQKILDPLYATALCVDDGQEAVTHYFPVSSNERYSYVRLKPKTGRTHQIRVHMSAIGHPLAGDILYGGDNSAKRHLLHCESLSFTHPITNEKIKIKAPLPEDFLKFSEKQNLRLLQ